MPEFSTAFTGLNADRKISPSELVRTIRLMVAAEYEAVQMYMQVAESTDNELAKAVLKDISDEELVHAGEFLQLLRQLAPNEESLYVKGYEEVKEMMENLKQHKKSAGTPVPVKVGSRT